jgi:hypothetical protein
MSAHHNKNHITSRVKDEEGFVPLREFLKYKPCDELTEAEYKNILEHSRSQQFEFIVDKALGTKVRIKKSCVSQSVGKDGRDVLSDPSTAKDGVVARDTEIHWNHVYTSFTPVPLYRSGATGKKLLAKYGIRNPLSGHKFTDIHEFKSSDPNVLSLYQFGGKETFAGASVFRTTDNISTAALFHLPALSPLPSGLGVVWSPNKPPIFPGFDNLSPKVVDVSPSKVPTFDIPPHSEHWMVVPTGELKYWDFIELINNLGWKNLGPFTDPTIQHIIPPPHAASGVMGLVMHALYHSFDRFCASERNDPDLSMDMVSVIPFLRKLYDHHLARYHNLTHTTVPAVWFPFPKGVSNVLASYLETVLLPAVQTDEEEGGVLANDVPILVEVLKGGGIYC